MLRKRQTRSFMWAAAAAFGFAAVVSWWNRIEDGTGAPGFIMPAGLTLAALVWLANAIAAKAATGASRGEQR